MCLIKKQENQTRCIDNKKRELFTYYAKVRLSEKRSFYNKHKSYLIKIISKTPR